MTLTSLEQPFEEVPQVIADGRSATVADRPETEVGAMP